MHGCTRLVLMQPGSMPLTCRLRFHLLEIQCIYLIFLLNSRMVPSPGNALISQNKKHLVSITCNSVSQQINIQELFTAFNNFAQNFIVDKNLKGTLNSTISFYAQWDSTLRFFAKNTLRPMANLKLQMVNLCSLNP